MGSGWHWYIVIFTVVNIVACLWLIVWASNQGDEDKGDMDTLDHTWDGDLMERNNPLPRWWLYLFLGTIVWGFGYLAWYPGLGAFAGVGGWSQIGQYEEERARIDAVYSEVFTQLAAMDVQELANHPEGMDIASRLFGANCATCHGSDGRGATGFPNLTDEDWQWGGSPASIEQTIRLGRQGVMPPWGAALGEAGVKEVVAYVKQLSGLPHATDLATAGKTRYDTMCVACHGPGGEGMQALGAPNLTDKRALYGRSDRALNHSIAQGRNGVMPAHETLLSAEEIKLLTAYVLSISSAGQAAGAP